MKKIIILFLSIFVLTGCSAEYNIVYENNILSENLNIISNKTDDIVNKTSSYYNRNYFIDYKLQLGDMNENEYIKNNGGIYNKTIIDEDNNYGLKLGYSYEKIEEYKNSSIVFNMFNDFYVNDNMIEASNIKNIFDNYNDLESVKIIFSSDKSIVSINADEELDGKYYWYIDKNNYKDKIISIRYQDNVESLIDNNGNFTGNIIKYIIMVLTIIVLISVIIIYEKIRKSNN